MPTAPSLISYTETSWSTTTTPKSTASISWNAGDILVAIGGSDGGTLGNPTATGLTFTTQKSVVGGSTQTGALVATAVAGSSSSSAVSMTLAGGAGAWGFGVWVWRNSGGVGNSASLAGSATKTVSLTPVSADSAIMWGDFDFNEAALGTIVPTPTNTRQRVDITGSQTIYVANLIDQTSAGAVSYGTSGGGSGLYSIVVVEIKGAAGGGFTFPPLLEPNPQCTNTLLRM
jgi:hypothetical protein